MFSFKKIAGSTALLVLLLSLFTISAYAAGSKAGVITGNDVNLRKSPSTSSDVLKVLSKGASVGIISHSDGWYKVKVGGKTGYVSDDYLAAKSTSRSSTSKKVKVGTVKADVLNVRKSPDLTAEVLTMLTGGDRVQVLSSTKEWYKVKITSSTTGWVAKQYLSVKTQVTSRSSDVTRITSIGDSGSSKGSEIAEYAKKFLGIDYVYGGNTPGSGFDCSGFTKYLYSHFGVELNRTADSQAIQGQYVSKGDLRIGDLVFFDTDGGSNHINHAGIYIGSGKMVHASSSKDEVIITDFFDSYYSRFYMTARRIFN